MKKTLLLFSLGLLGMTAFAEEATTFDCIADTWIRQSAPAAVNGTGNQIELGADGDNARAGLFGFDFIVEPGMKVEKATLRFITKLARTHGDYQTELYAYSNDFAESDACWNSEESYYNAALENDPIAAFDIKGHSGKAIYDAVGSEYQTLDAWTNDIDVTNYVKSLPITSSRVNFMLVNMNNASPQIRIYSRENTGDNLFRDDENGTVEVDGKKFLDSAEAEELLPYLIVTFAEDSDSATKAYLPKADTQIRFNNTTDFSQNNAMEVWYKLNEDGTVNNAFYGLLRFELPLELTSGEYELNGASLRLVCTQNKGDREMNLYDYENNFPENTTYAAEEEYLAKALDSEPVASFQAQGQGNFSMGDGLKEGFNADNFGTADKWTSNIDLTGYIESKIKNNETSFNLLLSKNKAGENKMKFATKEANDITNISDDPAKADGPTFKAEDLVPQLTLSYTKASSGNGTVAVETISIDLNAPVEYYDLSGRRVANPDKGIYIIRQGNNVKKAFIR